MPEDKTVAVDSTSAQSETDQEQSAQDQDLDSILSSVGEEFDKETKPPVSKEMPSAELTELRQTVDYLLNQTENGDIEKAVEGIAKNLDVNVPKRAIRGMLNDMAIEDPRIRKAFQNRQKDPTTWNKVQKAASKRIADEFKGLPDKSLTDDREAMAATIRGASKSTNDDSPTNMGNWSDARFNHWKMTGKDNPNL